jgi:hypothetical protein
MEDDFTLHDATIGIVGLGLMGGSLAMSLKGKCARIIGFDSHLPTIESALSLGIIDHASAFPSPFQGEGLGVRVNVLILATPVPSILTLLDQLRTVNYQLPMTILDLGSTKREITEAMSASAGIPSAARRNSASKTPMRIYTKTPRSSSPHSNVLRSMQYESRTNSLPPSAPTSSR